MKKHRLPSFSFGTEKERAFWQRPRVQKSIAVVLALIFWEILARLIADKLILVSPIDVLLRLFTIWQDVGFFAAVGNSFLRISLGFFLALAIGTVLAALAGRFPLLQNLLFPYMAAVKAVPVVSFIVIAYVWMSSRYIATLVTFLIVLPTVYTGLLAGIHAKDPKMEEMADIFGIFPSRRFFHVRLPQLAPYISSAVSLGAGLAFKSGIAAEIMTVPENSIGNMMYYASLWLKNVDLFTWTFLLIVISVAFEKGLSMLLKWGFGRLWRI